LMANLGLIGVETIDGTRVPHFLAAFKKPSESDVARVDLQSGATVLNYSITNCPVPNPQ